MKKKLWFIMLSVFAWTACSEDTSQTDGVVELPVFEATGRAILSDLDMTWQKSDQVSVFPKTQNNIQYQLAGGAGNSLGTFHAAKLESTILPGGTLAYYGAVYPYHESFIAENAGTGLAFRVGIPSEQTYTANSFDPQAALMLAVSDNLQLRFRNACSLLKLPLAGDIKVASISLTSNEGEKISGLGKVSFPKDGTPEWGIYADYASPTVTLKFGEAVQLSTTPTAFYLVLIPSTLSKGFTLSVTDVNGKTQTVRVDNELSFKRAEIRELPTLSLSLTDKVGGTESFQQGDQDVWDN